MKINKKTVLEDLDKLLLVATPRECAKIVLLAFKQQKKDKGEIK